MADPALLRLLVLLKAAGYRFTPPAPATHRRVLLRRGRSSARDLGEVLGWNMRFDDRLLDTEILAALHGAKALIRRGRQWISRYRVASIGDDLFLHAAFPAGEDAAPLGPDACRFAHFIQRAAPRLRKGARILDIGSGSGVGGVAAARLAQEPRLTLADLSAKALALAAVNAQAAGQEPQLAVGDGLPPGRGTYHLIVANTLVAGAAPGRGSADGDAALGVDRAAEWAAEAAARLAPGGRFLLYGGSPVGRGADPLRNALAPIAQAAGCLFRYEEIDPDVAPATLAQPAYWGVERIAAVGAVFERPRVTRT